MLANFFKLNGEPERYDTIEALTHHFKTANDIRDLLYTPDIWPPDLRRMTGTTFTNVSLSKKTISEVTFTGCKFEDCLFIGTRFVGVEFHRCEFVNCNFYKSSFEDCYLDPGTIHFDRTYRKSAANVGVALYHALIENASKRRQSDFEMNADMQFRRWKRWQLVFDEKAKKIGRTERYRRTAASLAYELVAGFGYRPTRFVVCTVALFTFVAAINELLLPGALKEDGKAVAHFSFADSVYFTYSMMTALGFSYITPDTTLGKLASVAEALVGIGWLGVFTSVLVKRFLR